MYYVFYVQAFFIYNRVANNALYPTISFNLFLSIVQTQNVIVHCALCIVSDSYNRHREFVIWCYKTNLTSPGVLGPPNDY